MVRRASVVLGLAVGLLSGCASVGHRQSSTGAETFMTSCAVCHGRQGRGDGAAAPLISAAVPDLTLIASRRNGEFPAIEMYRLVSGLSRSYEPGERHMPIWGYEFFGQRGDDEQAHREATQKIEQIVAWLESIQRTD